MSELAITDLAATKLAEYLAENEIESALRIALMPGGCSGPALGLALDEKKESDKTFEKENLSFLVEESLFDTTGDITVDYVDAGPRSGFSLTSEKSLGGGGGCGSCSGSCG